MFETVNLGCPPSKPHTFSARLLFETFMQADVFAVVNCPLPCRSVECVLLHHFNARPYIFRVAGYFCNYTLLCNSVECCVLLRSPNLVRL